MLPQVAKARLWHDLTAMPSIANRPKKWPEDGAALFSLARASDGGPAFVARNELFLEARSLEPEVLLANVNSMIVCAIWPADFFSRSLT